MTNDWRDSSHGWNKNTLSIEARTFSKAKWTRWVLKEESYILFKSYPFLKQILVNKKKAVFGKFNCPHPQDKCYVTDLWESVYKRSRQGFRSNIAVVKEFIKQDWFSKFRCNSLRQNEVRCLCENVFSRSCLLPYRNEKDAWFSEGW